MSRYEPISPKLRKQILHRDNFKCQTEWQQRLKVFEDLGITFNKEDFPSS